MLKVPDRPFAVVGTGGEQPRGERRPGEDVDVCGADLDA